MSADDDVDLTCRDLLEQLLTLRLFDPAPHNADSIIQRSEDSFRVEKVLLGEDLSRGHQRGLVAIRYSNDDCFQGHDRFSASHVALQEPDHRVRGLRVIHDFFQDPFLCPRRMERQDRLHLLPDALGGLEAHT